MKEAKSDRSRHPSCSQELAHFETHDHGGAMAPEFPINRQMTAGPRITPRVLASLRLRLATLSDSFRLDRIIIFKPKCATSHGSIEFIITERGHAIGKGQPAMRASENIRCYSIRTDWFKLEPVESENHLCPWPPPIVPQAHTQKSVCRGRSSITSM